MGLKIDGFEGKGLQSTRWRPFRLALALKVAIGTLSLALFVTMFLAFRAPTLEEFLVSRLEQNGVSAGIAEDGFDEATISATTGGRRIFILVRSPQFVPRGVVRKAQTFGQITAKLVTTTGVRDVWRFDCKLKDFGLRTVDLVRIQDPATSVPEIYRSLQCDGASS